MKNAIVLTFFTVVLVSIFVVSCPIISDDNTVTIKGTVIISRNGIPWNSINFPSSSYSLETTNTISRGVPPPTPWIRAYKLSETGNKEHIGTAYLNTWQNNLQITDNDTGAYNWSMKIPPDILPNLIYFEVLGGVMGDVDYFGGSNDSVKISEGIYVENEKKIVDIGIIDFKVLRLSGNLLITINGEPFDYNHSWVTMYVSNLQTSISSNGDWSFNFFPLNSPRQLNFRIEAVKGIRVDNVSNGNNYAKYSYFKEELNSNNVITLFDSNIELNFPSVDFKAYTISGTIKFNPSGGDLSWYNIHIYSEETQFYTMWNFQIASIVDWLPSTDNNNTIYWETIVPAFSFPHILPFWIRSVVGSNGRQNLASKNILINSEDDLKNIYLGSYNIIR